MTKKVVTLDELHVSQLEEKHAPWWIGAWWGGYGYEVPMTPGYTYAHNDVWGLINLVYQRPFLYY